MTDDIAFSELETDPKAAAAFDSRWRDRADALLAGPELDADIATTRALLDDPDRLAGLSRRGKWVYTFRSTPDSPRGVWQRVADGVPIGPDTDWQTVFDMEAYCRDTEEDWHWRGAETAHFNPDLVLIALSQGGSDQTRYIEFDTNTGFVAGGFDLPASRSNVSWLDADTVLWASNAGDNAGTVSGWPRVVRQVTRTDDPTTAPIVHEVDPAHLLAVGYTWRGSDGVYRRGDLTITAINQTRATLHMPDGTKWTIPSPENTSSSHNATHYAYVQQTDGDHPAGALVLGRIGEGPLRTLATPGAYQSVSGTCWCDDWLLWIETDRQQPTLRALDLRHDTGQPVDVALPEEAQSVNVWHFDNEPDPDRETLALGLAGMTTPWSQYLFDLKAGVEGISWTRLYAAPTAFDAAGTDVRLHSATSADGTEVPYHIVLPAGHADMMGQIPVFQYGYGGFNAAMTPHYNSVAGKLWIERGGAYVIAYIRGGGEFGPDWYLQAKGPGRDKAFADFAAVARDLVARGYTSSDRIGCHGGSNGGLLCGVMLTRYPADFGAVWASVGVMDMLRFHRFPAGAGWIDEYGDPDDPDAANWLRSYSPIHNVADTPTYPPSLIDTGAHDDRVDPSHSRRFAAVLEAAGQPVTFLAHSGGHGGGGGSDTRAREQATGYRFMWKMLTKA